MTAATERDSTTLPVLCWQFALSHYVEKVRWALDLKRVPHVRRSLLPGLHINRIKKMTSQTPVPVLEFKRKSSARFECHSGGGGKDLARAAALSIGPAGTQAGGGAGKLFRRGFRHRHSAMVLLSSAAVFIDQLPYSSAIRIFFTACSFARSSSGFDLG
jgi:hypothetical protein